jgi:acetyl esterase/lipase
MGSSAGGHLAACYCTLENPEHRADALILSYPVITAATGFCHGGSFVNLLGKGYSEKQAREWSPELHVSEKTPPCFIWHTFADESVPAENSLLFARALKEKNVPFELHVFPNGPHGLSLATPETATERRRADPHVAKWFPLCIEWLSELFGFEI